MEPSKIQGAQKDNGEEARGGLSAFRRLWLRPPAFRPATPWSPIDALLATGVIILVADALTGLMLGNAYAIFFHRLLPVSGLLRVVGQRAIEAATLTNQTLTVLLTLVASCQFGGRIRDTPALGRPQGGMPAYISGVLLTFLITFNLLVLLNPCGGSTENFRIADRLAWLMNGLILIVGAPLSEELLMRAFLTSALSRSPFGYRGAAVVTSALWAALHLGYSWIHYINLFVAGLFLCWLLWRTGSVRVPIACHACFDAFVFLIGSKLTD
jgi:membrane protease YdiL (CAAX protease family)